MSEQNKFDSTYSAVVSMAEQMVGEGKYDSTYSAVLAIYQNLTSDMDTKFDSVYSIVVKIADGIESGDIDPGGGGGSDEPINYNTHKFYNWNGELVEEWTLEETQSKTELPVVGGVPFNDWTLDFDGWNWDLEQLKSASCGQNIGAMYRPSDGKTRIIVDIEPENLTYVLFVGGDYTEVDWGDGTIQTEFDGSPTHTYESEGRYTIMLTGTDIRPQWGVSPLFSQIFEGYPGWYYGSRVKTFLSGVKLNSICFGYCTNLEYLTFTSDTHVYDSSFYKFNETKSLKYLAIPKGITSYPTTGKSIEVISMPYGVTSISSWTFRLCSLLKSINIPDSVTRIDNPFPYCSSLQFINIPNSVTNINSAFQGCSSLQSVTIPNGVTNINSAFQDCSSLQSITIPDSVTTIGDSMFKGCSSLQSVTIPNGVTTIGNSAFQECGSLQSINIPDSVTTIGNYVFQECGSLQSINIPDGITNISFREFYYCSSLQSVNIPDGVTSINNYAFSGCQYITVDFSDNTQIPTLSSTSNFDSTALILVPESLYDEWINATNWSSLTSQIVKVSGK